MKIIAIQADKLSALNLKTDSSVLLAQEWNLRGYNIFWYHPQDVEFNSGAFIAKGALINDMQSFVMHNRPLSKLASDSNMQGVAQKPMVLNVCEDSRTLHGAAEVEFPKKSNEALDIHMDLAEASALLIRQNPPFNQSYIANTYLLEHLKIPMFNSPSAIRNCSEKLSTLNFPEFIPNTIVTSSAQSAEDFAKVHNTIILKSLFDFGGNNVMQISISDEKYQRKISAYFKKFGTCIAQQYLPSIRSDGDKRIFIISGEVIGGIRRIPKEGSFLSGLASGGSALRMDHISDYELQLSKTVASWLKHIGIFMAGIDIIASRLIEINVTSPTGFKVYNGLNPDKEPIEKKIIDMMESEIL